MAEKGTRRNSQVKIKTLPGFAGPYNTWEAIARLLYSLRFFFEPLRAIFHARTAKGRKEYK
jgi:hypothetical protein